MAKDVKKTQSKNIKKEETKKQPVKVVTKEKKVVEASIVEDKKENIEYLSKHLKVICVNTLNNKDVKEFDENRVTDSNEIYFKINKIICEMKNKNNSYEKLLEISITQQILCICSVYRTERFTCICADNYLLCVAES